MQNEFVATAQQYDLDGNLVTTMRCEECGLWHRQLMTCDVCRKIKCWACCQRHQGEEKP